ncbi:MAG: hypothetical protein JW751_15335 [Polyangiaceae bacterium]|nr:hypothetical protein [Polyangiaceae bacterium]
MLDDAIALDWDLGTGDARDIGLQSPNFFDDPQRRHALTETVNGSDEFQMQYETLEGRPAFSVSTTSRIPNPPPRVRELKTPQAILLLVTPGECPHLIATGTCAGGKYTMSVRQDEIVPCFGPYTAVGKEVVVTQGAGTEPHRVKVGVPTPVPGFRPNWGSFVAVADDVPPLQLDPMPPFKDATPFEVLGLVEVGGMERVAADAYKNVREDWKVEDLAAAITDRRVTLAKDNAAKISTPSDALKATGSYALGAGLPGDDEVIRTLQPKLREIASRVANEGTTFEFRDGLRLLRLLRMAEDDPTAEAFDEHYGPMIGDGVLDDPSDLGAFATAFPNSKYTELLRARAEMRAAKQRTEMAEAQAANEIAGQWETVVTKADEIAQLSFKIRFAQQYLAPSPQNTRGLSNMQAYRRGLVTDSFCPAKREFIKAAGIAEYQRLAKEHCDEEAPTGSGMNGESVTLTNDCRMAFATGC